MRIESFSSIHYCPRMSLMNKPIYQSIQLQSPDKPVLIFVASRRQCRLTANALISFCALNDNPFQFLRECKNSSSESISSTAIDLNLVEDPSLKFSLAYGITIHHAGLSENDRMISEHYFSSGMAQIMISTTTLAWGVNFPAHMVIIKGKFL